MNEEATSQIAEFRAAASVLIERIQWMRQHGITFKGERDLYEVLGYERVLTAKDYRDAYARGGIAGRVVDALPAATWRGTLELIEDEDPDASTAFEKAWVELDKRLQVAARLRRVDILAGQGRFAVLLIGAPGELNTELPRGRPEKLLYLTPFAEDDATITTWDTDPASKRFGLPLEYQLRRTDFSALNFTQPAHWTRCIHVAEGCLDNDVYGMPTLERIWNLLHDLEKVTGGGAEAFWLRANQGLQLDIDKDMNLSDPAKAALNDEVEQYKHGISRIMKTKGVTPNVLGSDVANFSNPADAILTQIAGSKAIPKRILTGSEMGELASSQDRDNWKDQIGGRQTGYAGPFIVRPLVDRLIDYGYLPTPKQYEVRWEGVQTLTEAEKSTGAKDWAAAKTDEGQVFTRSEIRDKWYGMEPLTDEQLEEMKPEEPPAVETQMVDPETGKPMTGPDGELVVPGPRGEPVIKRPVEEKQETEDEKAAKKKKKPLPFVKRAASGEVELTAAEARMVEYLEGLFEAGHEVQVVTMPDGEMAVRIEEQQ